MLKIEDLQAFTLVVDAGSFTAAAERMNVAKSAVSRRITDLERQLGAQLLQRSTRRLSLTATGTSFYERAVRILCDLEEAEQAVAQEHGQLSGVLRVTVPLSFGLAHLSPAITDFMRQHPKVEFDIQFNDRQVDLIQEGFDVAVRIGQLADSNLVARPIAPITQVLCASPHYLKMHGTPTAPEELQQHAFLAYSNIPDPHTLDYHDEHGQAGRVQLRIAHKANSGDFLRAAAIAGHGIVRQPTFIVYRAIEAGELVPLLKNYRWSEMHAYAVYPQTRHLSRRVRAFVDFLVERFAGVPYWDQCMAK